VGVEDRGPVKAVVIGVGHLGQHHARLMKEVPGAELVGIVDSNPERAATIAAPLGVPAYSSLADIPEGVGAASVAVPTSHHRDIVIPLLERGIQVLVEKPMAATLDEAREMERVATERGLVLQVGHIERFNPALSVFHDLDVQPRFIEAHRLAPFNFRTLDVSVVMDLMIHDIDIVMELAGAPLKRVDAVGSKVLGRHVDIANARLEFENGCVANVTASRVSFEPLRRTRVFGDETFVSMDFGTRRAFVVRKNESFDLGSLDAASQERLEPKADFKEFLAQGLMDAQEIDMDEANPLLSELTAFIANVRGEDAGGVSAQAGLRAMEVAMQISQTIEEHRWT
jgi:predicted dehydrogenase